MQILINESLKGIFVMGIDISIALHTLDIEYYSMKLPRIRAVTQWRLIRSQKFLSSDYETISYCMRTDMVWSQWILCYVKMQRPNFSP